MQTILIVDDNSSLRTLVRDYLSEQGYRALTAENGQNALYTARREKPHLILLDIMMPKMDGYQFITAYRKESNAPIMLLTAKLEETDKVLGLELGADDYLTKPFGMRELLARVRALLRRAGADVFQPDSLRAADILLERDTRQVRVDGKSVSLTPSEFDLLAILMESPGRVYARADLLIKLQGTTFEGAERTIDVHIRNLRTKIEPDASNPRYIETVFGVGYRFCEQ